MIRYKTVLKESITEQTIDKSRFIGHIKPVESREEAEDFFSAIRADHKAATHNVPAFVIGEQFQLQWASDDGEPQGTSGAPIVQMLVKEGITNIAVMITRYFGGIKLGTGGLVRAYTGTTKLALEDSGICEVKEQRIFLVRMEYTFYGKFQNLSLSNQFRLGNTLFEDMIKVELIFDIELTEEIRTLVSNVTGGAGVILEEWIALEKVEV